MTDERRNVEPVESAADRISIYRSADGRALTERAARLAEEVMFNLEGAIEAADPAAKAGELPVDALRELRELHTLVRQRALSEQPQGRLV